MSGALMCKDRHRGGDKTHRVEKVTLIVDSAGRILVVADVEGHAVGSEEHVCVGANGTRAEQITWQHGVSVA